MPAGCHICSTREKDRKIGKGHGHRDCRDLKTQIQEPKYEFKMRDAAENS
jgi:hypothetical protein